VSGRTVWLASYPKSGNTWLRAVYTALTCGADLDINSLGAGLVPATRELLDSVLGVPASDLTADEVDMVRPRADEVLEAAATDAVYLRKVHDGFYPGPSGEPPVSVAASRAAIYLVRDPRDVAVSYANHTGRSVEWAAAELCSPRAAMAGSSWHITAQTRQRLGTWSDHVRSWTEQAPMPVHVVRYEDASRDPVRVFGAALRFAGLDVTEDELASAVERASFDRLRAQEAEHGFHERGRRCGAFFRRGAAGSWRDELPAPLADRIVAAHRDTMRRLDYLSGAGDPP
jgi:aryl sulfotransferase